MRNILKLTPIFFLFLYAELSYANPQIKLSTLDYNFGEVNQKEIVRGFFKIKNSGNDKLVVRLTTTCDCLFIDKDIYELAGNQIAEIEFTYDTSNDSGYISKELIITSNDQENDIIYFKIEGNVRDIDYDKTVEIVTVTEPGNAIEIYTYNNCKKCAPLVERVKEWALKKNRGVSVYDLEQSVNKERIYNIVRKKGVYPNLPLVVFDGNYYGGKNDIESLLKEKNPINERGKSLNVLLIFTAGLIDGINPCAFTLIILLISYLLLNLKSKKTIIVSGFVYIISVFIIYFLIGLGFFKILKSLTIYSYFGLLLKYGLSAILLILSILSLIDFITIYKTGKTERVILKLPPFFQKTIRKSIREQMNDFKIILGSLTLGVTVSLFEFICTGQVYLPVIGFMVNNKEKINGIIYLIIYNIGFIIPLILIFSLVIFGASLKKIQTIFSSNFKTLKIIFCILFLILSLINLISL